MPPKQAGRKAAQKGYASTPEDKIQTLLGQSPGVPLPSVPIAQSWNYGAQGVTALPTSSPVDPNSGFKRIAQRIQLGQEIAQKRDSPPNRSVDPENRSPSQRQPRPRGRQQPAANSASPVRPRTKREPTPDQTQLLQSLRQATESPEKEGPNQPSDATPSPPIPHAVSTDSSPDTHPPQQRRLSVMSNSPLYPSPLKRVGDHRDAPVGSTPDRQGSVDNASEVSWNLERDIHEDDLQRTRPSKYRGEPHGRNITKPPRRPSGLAIVQETIEEEEGEESASEPDTEPVAEPVQTWTAPARTIIPQIFRRSRSPENVPDPSSPKEGLVERWLSSLKPDTREGQPVEPPSRTNWIRAVAVLILSLLLLFSYRNGYLQKLHFPFPLRDSSLLLPPNITESQIFYGLRNQVSSVNAEVSSLSRELKSVRSQHSQDNRPTYAVDPIAAPHPTPKVNFLSPALGAIVDPDRTTPTTGRKMRWYERLLMRFLSQGSPRGPLPPVAALTSWEDVGDCWCSTPRNGVSQLAVFLNQKIVPEELIVEHIPAGATLDPGAAPKNIEMWARFRIVPMDSVSKQHSRVNGIPWISQQPTQPAEPQSAREAGLGGYNIPGEATLHEVLLSSLRASHPSEDESAYSDDPILGPNFYRVGKMEYDIHKENHIQRFLLNTVVDIATIRVDKVVFRVTSNWGSNTTCIYRLRLHGHV